jgi:hypothetical protein
LIGDVKLGADDQGEKKGYNEQYKIDEICFAFQKIDDGLFRDYGPGGRAGYLIQESVGQTEAHCGSSKCPLHSTHLSWSMT